MKRFSDLDLAVEGTLTWAQHADLTDAFDESLLPIKVDVVALDTVTADFRQRIEPSFIPVQIGAAPEAMEGEKHQAELRQESTPESFGEL